MTFEVRPATEADAAVLADLIDTFNIEYGRPGGLHTAESVLRDGFGPDRAFTGLIAWDGEVAAGYTLYYPTWESITPARGIYMQDLWVKPAYRSHGVGPVLMAALARIARDRGATHLWWSVERDNHRGEAFYRRLGATETPPLMMCLEGAPLDALANRL